MYHGSGSISRTVSSTAILSGGTATGVICISRRAGPEQYFTGKALVHMIYTDEKQEHRTEAYNVDSRREPARTDIRIPVDRF